MPDEQIETLSIAPLDESEEREPLDEIEAEGEGDEAGADDTAEVPEEVAA
jgi:hypothetical protein